MTELFEFRFTFGSGRQVLFYFHAKDSEDAWDRLWDKAREQGHDPHAIVGCEITWHGNPDPEGRQLKLTLQGKH